MRKLIKITFTAVAFCFLATNADDIAAQGKNKAARKEYKQEVREARKEYKREVREARREYKEDRREIRRYNRTYNRPPYGRANGYYNVRPYRGARRGFYRGRLPQNRYYVPRNRRFR